MNISVLGAGSWGTALAILLSRNGHQVYLWGRNAKHMAQLATTNCNARYLAAIDFPPTLSVYPDLNELVQISHCFLIVVPSHGFKECMTSLRAALAKATTKHKGCTVVWGTKGFEPETGRLLNVVVTDILGDNTKAAVLSGPTFANEIARGLPAAFTIASADQALAESVANWFRNQQIRVYTNTDIEGVQLGGAIKNVMAIATGISDGLGLGANARAALMTRGLTELSRLGVKLGGRAETFMGLTGLGDLMLTCTDDQSRNRRVGLGLGRGLALDNVLHDIGQEAEGIHAALELYRMSDKLNIEMPISEQVYRVLFEKRSAEKALTALMNREPRPE